MTVWTPKLAWKRLIHEVTWLECGGSCCTIPSCRNRVAYCQFCIMLLFWVLEERQRSFEPNYPRWYPSFWTRAISTCFGEMWTWQSGCWRLYADGHCLENWFCVCPIPTFIHDDLQHKCEYCADWRHAVCCLLVSSSIVSFSLSHWYAWNDCPAKDHEMLLCKPCICSRSTLSNGSTL